MSDLENQLIRLGYAEPKLRKHLEPVLSTLNKRAGKIKIEALAKVEEVRDGFNIIVSIDVEASVAKGTYIRDFEKTLKGIRDAMQEPYVAVREKLRELPDFSHTDTVGRGKEVTLKSGNLLMKDEIKLTVKNDMIDKEGLKNVEESVNKLLKSKGF